MKRKTFLFQLLAFIVLSQTAWGQVNFFTNEEQDSLAKNFYERGEKITVLAVTNVPSLQYGATTFIHNAENKTSYFFELKTNLSRRYVITGEELYGDGIRQKEVAYTTQSLNTGFARGFTRNWFVYGGFGVVIKNTKFDNQVEDNFRYHIPNNGVWFNIVGGAMYVANNNVSVLAGLDMYDRSITLGLGYTW